MRSSERSARRRVRCCSTLLMACLGAGMAAPAQQADPQTAQALARAQGLLRQIGQQKQQLEIDNAMLEAARASLEKRLRKAELGLEDAASDLAASRRDGQRTASTLERTRQRLDQTTAKLKEVVQKYKDTARTLQETTFAKQQLELELDATRRELADAETLNLELYHDNREILGLYKNKSGWTSFLQDEPFTGIKGVEVENVIEKYEYEMYDHLRESNLDAARKLKEASPLVSP